MSVRHIRPRGGRWHRLLLNLVLRLAIKWRWGPAPDVAAMRRRQARLERRLPKPPGGLTRVDAGGVAADWIGAPHSPRVILYLHGGAFVAKSPQAHAGMVHPWCEALGACALMVDYRLAPEHRFPDALEDCLAAWHWLRDQGHSAENIVLAGDSAGGNLALALLHRLNTAGEDLPVCTVLLSPFVDFTLSGRSLVAHARQDPVFTPAFALAIRNLYASPQQMLEQTVSPLFGDFRGLPPLLIQVGSTEMLLDDALRIGEAAVAAGVEAQVEVWHRMPHVFQAAAMLPQARQAASHIVDFIREHAGWSPESTTAQSRPFGAVLTDQG